MQASRPLVQRLLSQTARRYHVEGFKPPRMDELPVPKGSWQAQNDRNQRKYNSVLAFGIGFAIVSLVVAKTSGLIYLNWAPPQSID